MPCYQINTINVEFKGSNIEYLKKALLSLNIANDIGERDVFLFLPQYNTIRINIATGKAVMKDRKSNFDILNKIKREYTQEVLKDIAVKKRWLLRKRSINNYEFVRV